MSEYWKSTLKYWCKYCSEYVKDTKFERQKHEATGRHQGGIQRQLRGIHREQANQARQQQRAKDEVTRLNSLVPSSSSSSGVPAAGNKPTFAKPEEQKATLPDRKKQWDQLAAMGIAVPNGEVSGSVVNGDWTVVSEKVVGEVGEDGVVREVTLNKGVRKRKLDEEEEERIQAGETITKKKGWGHTYKSLPGKRGNVDEDVEALFNKKPAVKNEQDVEEAKRDIKSEDEVKREDAPSSLQDIPTAEEAATGVIKREVDVAAPAVVFKKRKKIAK